MDYTEEVNNNRLILHLEGNLDMLNAGILKERMMEAVVAHYNCIILDMSKVTFVDSSGFGLLIMVNEKLKLDGQNKLRIANVSKSIQQVFRISKISEVVDVYLTLEDATRS
ncbi:STAS domain-containing protein [Leptospira sp. GIMC2001]|uniref:STAS domain-containing protein n=1 Tax=Leptospira sp. GIMC2001 TaxID=1513297 RepID=UPI00234ACB5A|nr:STAS domain-containing protein [Leptospira sp. GIMC2001]WCL49972.1 STAS domain-containing protein [Leptospira sp. GIMC2001]